MQAAVATLELIYILVNLCRIYYVFILQKITQNSPKKCFFHLVINIIDSITAA